MSNNSLSDISTIPLNNSKCNTDNVMFSINKKITTYLNEPLNIKYTVIRLYFQNLLKLLRESPLNKSQLNTLMQFKIVLNSAIINDTSYDFPKRVYIIIRFLYNICETDKQISDIIKDWDNNTVYL